MENGVRAYSIRVHDKAKLTTEDFDDRIELKLVNKETGKESNKTYYKLDSMTLHEVVKIDAIVYHMHNDIGLNLWGYEYENRREKI